MTIAQRLAQIFGWVFIIVGVGGFFVTGGSMDPNHLTAPRLLGIFPVNVAHNIVHLLFGVAGLAMARRADTARTFLIGGGLIYLVLWIYGLVIDERSDANFVPLNDADNWLHFVLGVGMLALGFLLGRRLADGRGNTASARP